MVMNGLAFRRARPLRWAIAAWLAGLGWVAPAFAQGPEAAADERVPGWIFTPAVRFAASYDDNAIYRGEGDVIASDYLTVVGPTFDLSFAGKRTWLSIGYGGAFWLYRELDELNSLDQRGSLDLRHRATRHVTVFARDIFVATPTTDRLELGGVPFVREGVRVNNARAGLEAQLTRRFAITGGYEHQWVRFDDDTDLPELLRGGYAHGGFFETRYTISDRVAVGTDYSMRRALVGTGREQFEIHLADGVVELRLTPDVMVSGAAGLSRLRLGDADDRNGILWRLGLDRRGRYTTVSLGYYRSLVPSFGFGGTMQNEELTARIRAPLGGRRAYVAGNTAWRINTPLTPGDPELRSFHLRAGVGYALTRTVEVEGFYSGIFQDARIPGGRMHRNQIGFQIVTAAPMRIR